MLVVVAILALLATVGVLQLTRARIITHEELALISMRQVARACHFFNLANQRFPTSLTELSTANPQYIPTEWSGLTVEKQGYRFTYANPSPTSFSLNADPITVGVTGSRYFYMDQGLVMHVDQSGPADASDPVIP